MFQRLRSSPVVCAIAMLYVLAMATVGFAHKGMAGNMARLLAAPDAALALVALPDGRLPSLCLEDTGQPQGTTFASAICDACLITASPGLGAIAGFTLRPPASVALPVSIAATREAEIRHVIRLAARGPPAAMVRIA